MKGKSKKAINHVLKYFDFNKVIEVRKALKWTGYDTTTKEKEKECARELLENVVNLIHKNDLLYIGSGTWGYVAWGDKYGNLELRFQITDSEWVEDEICDAPDWFTGDKK